MNAPNLHLDEKRVSLRQLYEWVIFHLDRAEMWERLDVDNKKYKEDRAKENRTYATIILRFIIADTVYKGGGPLVKFHGIEIPRDYEGDLIMVLEDYREKYPGSNPALINTDCIRDPQVMGP